MRIKKVKAICKDIPQVSTFHMDYKVSTQVVKIPHIPMGEEKKGVNLKQTGLNFRILALRSTAHGFHFQIKSYTIQVCKI